MGNTDRSGYLLHKNENADIKDVHNIVHDIQKSGTDGVWIPMGKNHNNITSTTFIDINGLKYPVEPHSRYFIDWVLFVDTTTTDGLYACVNAPDDFNYMALSIFDWNGKAQTQDFNDFVGDILVSISGTFPLRISGYIETGDSGGYLQGRIAAAEGANTITVHIGSGGIVKKIS